MKLSVAARFLGLCLVSQAYALGEHDDEHTHLRRRRLTESGSCMEVILTGTAGGPALFEGLAGSGTLVTYGTEENDCRDVLLQLDVGRGTATQLSKQGLGPADIDAVFFTHMHSDHVEGFAVFMFNRWIFQPPPTGQPDVLLDVICSEDVPIPQSPTSPAYNISCQRFVETIGDPFIASGEIAQRRTELPFLNPGGPAALTSTKTFAMTSPTKAELVWQSKDGNVNVKAITTNHIGGHASYRVDTPVGSVVIGGDASNDEPDPMQRDTSTSAQVELLATGANILVHTAVHPVFGAEGSTVPPNLYNRQSNTKDIGAMAERAGVQTVMLTHLAPPIGATTLGPFTWPGGPLDEADFRKSVKQDGGFTGNVVVGGDLSTVRLPDDDDDEEESDDEDDSDE